jgi:hypothetical protein
MCIFVEEDNNDLNCELQSNEQLCAILGNKKPFINILQDEANTIHNIGKIILICLYSETFNGYL